jgi:SAM-dependent methyltransferase
VAGTPGARDYAVSAFVDSPIGWNAVVVSNFETLLAEAEAEPTEGWDFSWFDGRATEERPSWGYVGLLTERLRAASSALDVQTGGGEVLAATKVAPPRLVATESWPPNVEVAGRNLLALGAQVVAVDDVTLPFRGGSFDLIVSRHPVITPWDEICRVLTSGGSFLSQQVGAGSNHELIDFMMGPQPVGEQRSPSRHVALAKNAGLEVVELKEESLLVSFFDVGAVVYFLRKVLWTVPGFSVEGFRPRLVAMHELIEREGVFTAHAQRFLIEARKP